jgi:hypothetical protein
VFSFFNPVLVKVCVCNCSHHILFIIGMSVATATPPIVDEFVAPAIEALSSEDSGLHNINDSNKGRIISVVVVSVHILQCPELDSGYKYGGIYVDSPYGKNNIFQCAGLVRHNAVCGVD